MFTEKTSALSSKFPQTADSAIEKPLPPKFPLGTKEKGLELPQTAGSIKPRGLVSPEHLKERPRPPVKPKPRHVSIPHTDLDAAREMRGSVSNDSDLTIDSALTKSPHSNHSNSEFDLERLGCESDGGQSMKPGEEEGVKVVHNVKPSEFLKRRSRYRLQSRDGSVSDDTEKFRTDSGTFEDTDPTTPL